MSLVDPQAFWKLLADMPVCMLVTRDGTAVRSRPMAPNVDAAREEIRFLTRRSSGGDRRYAWLSFHHPDK